MVLLPDVFKEVKMDNDDLLKFVAKEIPYILPGDICDLRSIDYAEMVAIEFVWSHDTYEIMFHNDYIYCRVRSKEYPGLSQFLPATKIISHILSLRYRQI
jgi:hypothetical protein